MAKMLCIFDTGSAVFVKHDPCTFVPPIGVGPTVWFGLRYVDMLLDPAMQQDVEGDHRQWCVGPTVADAD